MEFVEWSQFYDPSFLTISVQEKFYLLTLNYALLQGALDKRELKKL